MQANALRQTLFSTSLVLGTALSATGSPLQAQGQQISISPDLSSLALYHQAEAAGPEQEWNCLDIGIEETAFRVVMPNYQSGDPVKISESKVFAKLLWEEAFFTAGGAVGIERDSGNVAGFEFDVYEGLNPAPAPGAYTLTAELIGVDATGASVDLGTLYLFDALQWGLRLDEMEVLMGSPLSQHSVWRGATIHAGGTGIAMRMLGQANTLFGNAYSGDQFRLGGGNWFVRDVLERVGVYLQFGSGHQIGGHAAVSPRALPAPQNLLPYYQGLAVPDHVFGGDLQILNDGFGNPQSADGTLLNGVVWVDGDVTVDGSAMTGTLTIVGGGSIDVSGSDNVLSAAVDGLLFWSSSTDLADEVSIDGGTNVLTGAVHAAALEVRVGGSGNFLTGRLVGDHVKLTGGSNTLSDGTH